MNSRWLRAILLLLIVVGGALRVLEVFQHNPLDHIFSDPARHWNQARETLIPSPMALFDPPLYQMWLSLVQKFTLGVPWLVAAIVAALSLLTPWFWYRFLRELLPGRDRALAGWALFTWLPSWLGIFDYFMTETLLLPLLGAALWQTLRVRRSPGIGSFVALALLWLLAGLARAVALPLGLAACLWVWWSHPQRWRAGCVAALAGALLLVPIGLRNHYYTGLWQPWGNGWPTRIYAESGQRAISMHLRRDGAQWTYGFTAPSMVQQPLQPFSSWTSVRSGEVAIDIDMTRGAADWRAALDAHAVQGVRRWWLRWENLLQIMVCESWPENNGTFLSGAAANASRWIWAPLLLVVVAGCIVQRRAVLREPLVPALVLLWFVLQAVSLVAVNEGRYRLPLEGLLLVQALWLLPRRVQGERSK
ncbi:MAG: glycosyltransferase family 39 protein [Steroidobacteraceae bacterium]